jgi:hypothetical protein
MFLFQMGREDALLALEALRLMVRKYTRDGRAWQAKHPDQPWWHTGRLTAARKLVKHFERELNEPGDRPKGT